MVAALMLTAGCAAPSAAQLSAAAQVDNTQITYDVFGARLDAHDGTIVQDPSGTLWLVGTSYGCGFQLNITSPWCGVRVYRSTDLQTWAPAGAVGGMYAFDHFGPDWQARCGGQAFGCFRPHIGRRADGLWVMWINTPATVAGYTVLTAPAPGGPYVEQAPPQLAVHDGSARLGGGDLDLVVDGEVAYLAYVTIGLNNTPADIVVERLDPAWTSGTGQFARLGKAMVESPGLYRRNGLWVMVYSDPAAPYGITGASYATAPALPGPWTPRSRISTTSCTGQSADVDTLTGPSGTVYQVWQVDRWAQAGGTFARNQYRANGYVEPLVFGPDGLPATQGCATAWTFA
jgi:hypothetical protein